MYMNQRAYTFKLPKLQLQPISIKGGLISENAEELLLLRKMCQISTLNKYVYGIGEKDTVHKTDL